MEDKKTFDAEKQIKAIKGTLNVASEYKIVKYAGYAAVALLLLYSAKYFLSAGAGTVRAYKDFSDAINS